MAEPRLWNFRDTSRFTADAIRSIHRLFEHLAPVLQTNLAPRLRVSIEVASTTLTPMPFESYLSQTAQAVRIIVPLKSRQLAGPLTLILGGSVLGVILSRELGGVQAQALTRQPTMTEARILTFSTEAIVKALGEAFQATLPAFDLTADEADVTGQLAGLVPPAETVLQALVEIQVLRVPMVLEVLVPYGSVEPILAPLAQGMQATMREEIRLEQIGPHIGLRKVNVEVELGRTYLSLHRALALKEGHTLTLPVRSGERVWGYVEGRPLFYGTQLGVVDESVALVIGGRLEASPK